MKTIRKLLEDEHFGIVGKTRSGKSYLGKELHRVADRSIYFNFPDKRRDDYEVPGKVADAETPKETLQKAIEEGVKLKYDSHWKDDVRDEELRAVYEVAKKALNNLPDSELLYFFIDEAHEFDENLIYLLRDALGHGIIVVPLTQNPDDLDKSALSQIEKNYIFFLSQQQKGWLNHYNVPYEDLKEWTTERNEDGEVEINHNFGIWDGHNFKKCSAIPWTD